MEIEILTPMATQRASYVKGDRVRWPDKIDAERLIKAGYARPANEPPKRG